MPVEVAILSGARQGHRQFLDVKRFQAGSNPGAEVYFDPRVDPSAKDRAAVLSLQSDGWYIQSTGGGEVFVNRAPVVGLTRLRSGTIVRMSEFGPEFEFTIVTRPSHRPDRQTGALVAIPASGTGMSNTLAPHPPASRTVFPVVSRPSAASWPTGRWVAISGAGTALILLVVATILINHWPGANPASLVGDPAKAAAVPRSGGDREERDEPNRTQDPPLAAMIQNADTMPIVPTAATSPTAPSNPEQSAADTVTRALAGGVSLLPPALW